MSSEEAQPARIVEESEFENDITAASGTVYVKWDVKGGSDRTHNPYIDTCSQLEGSPNIQGVEIQSAIRVKLHLYGNSNCTGDADIVEGPTNGKNKINAKRYGAYKLVAA
ncbi:hypothetical protein HG530_012999 [Fusarium avenaceum]|nr:hypothetical protein DER45DRAFT_598255 [Fusarium avenaceum]KAI6753823.1 hypothetical protein HG530_012999 [Fusarium avenaceum]KIL84678.1 hypothetical protein FAVG1_12205 [Fusarium avenaceum]